jgi:hypothetical protein
MKKSSKMKIMALSIKYPLIPFVDFLSPQKQTKMQSKIVASAKKIEK